MRRLMLAAVAVVAALGAGGAAMYYSSQSAPAKPQWVVTGRTTAHRMLVLNVDAKAPLTPMFIARELVEPVRERYDEVLVYVHGGRAGRNALRRVQWSPGAGYVETTIR